MAYSIGTPMWMIYIFHQRLAEVTSTEGGTVLIRQVPLGFSSLHRVSKMVA